jgi:hypothetical protein
MRGENISNEQTLSKVSDFEYSGTMPEQKKPYRFQARGEDYYTQYRKITVVPPPEINKMWRDEAQPAYLWHRLPSGSSPDFLRGKKQHFVELPISTMGEVSNFKVPAGTDVVLYCKSDKDLVLGGISSEPTTPTPIEQLDANTFRAAFPKVANPTEVRFFFVDTDGVTGSRKVRIDPILDHEPNVEVAIEVIRQVNGVYLVTPIARVPFSGKITDDRGLSKVQYVFTYQPYEERPSQERQIRAYSTVVPAVFGGLGAVTNSLFQVSTLSKQVEEEKEPERVDILTFRPTEYVTEVGIKRLLDIKLGVDPVANRQLLLDNNIPNSEYFDQINVNRRLVVEQSLDHIREHFDIEKVLPSLAVKDPNAIQPKYKMRLWIAATDNNLEAPQPGQGSNKVKFNLLIVSENELLVEIGKEEENLRMKFEDTVNRVKDARSKVESVSNELPSLKKDEFVPMTRRVEEVEESIIKAWDASREVVTDYKRILEELLANRVRKGMIDRVEGKIIIPLEQVLMGGDPPPEARGFDFERADRSVKKFRETLQREDKDPRAAAACRDDLDRLVRRLQEILDAMSEIEGLNKLIQKLVEIEKSQSENIKILEARKRQLEEEIFKSLQ